MKRLAMKACKIRSFHSQQDSGLQLGKLFQSQKCYEGKKNTKVMAEQRRIVQKMPEKC